MLLFTTLPLYCSGAHDESPDRVYFYLSELSNHRREGADGKEQNGDPIV